MKELFVFIIFILVNFTSAQLVPDKVYVVNYESTFKRYHKWKGYDKELTTLLVKGDSSIYQVYNIMRTDTLKVKNPNFNPGAEGYFSYHTYAIKINSDSLRFSDDFADEEYFYKERLNFDWKLGSKSMEIQGYNCRSATTTYGGRNWEAWYAIDLPLNAGPYKFKGLPGLIIKVTDASKSYAFLFKSIEQKTVSDFGKYHHLKPRNEWIEMTKDAYNKLYLNYNSLDINGRMNFGKSGPPVNFEISSSNDNVSLREVSNQKRAKGLNFIEIDQDMNIKN